MRIILGLTVLMCLSAVGITLAGDPDLTFYFSYDGIIAGDTVLDESGKGHDGGAPCRCGLLVSGRTSSHAA